MQSMAWITAPQSLAEDQAPRVAQALTECERIATEAENLSGEVRDAITAFRLQMHLDDRAEPWP